jgi:hypothetical protein
MFGTAIIHCRRQLFEKQPESGCMQMPRNCSAGWLTGWRTVSYCGLGKDSSRMATPLFARSDVMGTLRTVLLRLIFFCRA